MTASRVEAVFDIAGSRALGEAEKRRLTARLGPRATAVAQEHRGQARNRELALERLRDRLASALRVSRPRRPTRPTSGARQRRLDQKRRNSERKRGRRPPREDW